MDSARFRDVGHLFVRMSWTRNFRRNQNRCDRGLAWLLRTAEAGRTFTLNDRLEGTLQVDDENRRIVFQKQDLQHLHSRNVHLECT